MKYEGNVCIMVIIFSMKNNNAHKYGHLRVVTSHACALPGYTYPYVYPTWVFKNTWYRSKFSKTHGISQNCGKPQGVV